jgi:hypothetical protein
LTELLIAFTAGAITGIVLTGILIRGLIDEGFRKYKEMS